MFCYSCIWPYQEFLSKIENSSEDSSLEYQIWLRFIHINSRFLTRIEDSKFSQFRCNFMWVVTFRSIIRELEEKLCKEIDVEHGFAGYNKQRDEIAFEEFGSEYLRDLMLILYYKYFFLRISRLYERFDITNKGIRLLSGYHIGVRDRYKKYHFHCDGLSHLKRKTKKTVK